MKRSRIPVAMGNSLFHYRNALFPTYIIALVFFARPLPSLAWDGLPTVACKFIGVAMAFIGESIRLVTIGFPYIERGGKNRQVYASHLVTSGVFAHVRNPMYIGNILIVTGLSFLTASVAGALISIILFTAIYRLIIAAEEEFLHREFGMAFETYSERVNRFVPNLTAIRSTFSGMHFQWRRALRKDYGNLALIGFLLAFLPVWRRFFLLPHKPFPLFHGRSRSS